MITSFDGGRIANAAAFAQGIGLDVLGPSDPAMNGYRSLLICPDGSKEGWPDSDKGDERREEMREWLDSHKDADGSSAFSWVEFSFSPDDHTADLVAHAWAGEN
ncbi:MAG: hypothetical protein IPL28_25580 [Chloroflexi bacterium]|nr:hypothetical protein [Chloroflexota bacterium]